MENTNNVVNEEIKIESTETNSVEVKEEKTFTQEELDKILNKKFEDIKEGFDYWPDNNDYQCKNLKEYKNMIRKICHCKKKKWNRSRMKKLFC